MTRVMVVAMLVAACILGSGTLFAMPLRPDLADRLQREGKLADEEAMMAVAHKLGVDNLGENKVFHAGPGAPLVLTTRQAIVILIDFSDNVANQTTYPASHYIDMLFSVGTYPTGSMRDYYLENSYGNFTVTGQATNWLRMPQTYAYYVYGQRGIYGDYPHNCQKMVEDAVIAANPYVNFAQYDNDGPDGVPNSGDDDGYVDALFVVHAGPGYEVTHNVNDIHSHAWSTSYPVPVDGVYAYSYSTEPDNGTIGVFCHEFGHVLGCPDLYDYGYDSRGVGYWSVMSFGSWGNGGITPVQFDAWDKNLLGFLSATVPTSSVIDANIPEVENNAVAYKVWTGGSPANEFFMFEYRRKIKFDAYLPGTGVVIYHVDENMPDEDSQRCGSGSPHYLVAVEQADGKCDLENYTNNGDTGDPYPGSGGTGNPNHALNLISTPNSKSYANSATGVSIYNIRMVDSLAYASVAVGLVPPTARVIAPNGGWSYAIGSPDTVRWIAFDDIAVDSLSILLSRDGGATYPTVLGHGQVNDSSFVWTVTGPQSEHCRIKVVAYDRSGYSAYDVSDADFKILDVAGVAASVPTEIRIMSVSPNPASEGARVVFSSPSVNPRAGVYDVTGKLVKSLETTGAAGYDSAPGTFEARWDGRSARGATMAPGIYFVRVTSGEKAETARVTIAR
jgi:immune inhibitor A